MAHNDDEVFAKLAAQLAELTAKVRALSELMAAPAHQQERRRDHLKVIDVRDLTLFAEPVAYHEEKQVENERTTDLRRQLHEAEAELEGAETWVERARAQETVRSLRRELEFAEYDRPAVTHYNLIGVERQPLAEMRFMPPSTPFTDREDCERRAEKFERRTGQY